MVVFIAIILLSRETSDVCVDCVLVLGPSVSAAVTATCFSHRTSSSSTIIARPTRQLRLFTITRMRPTSTRGGVISNWSSPLRRRRQHLTPSRACMPGKMSRPCSTEAVDDAFTTSNSSSTSASLYCHNTQLITFNLNSLLRSLINPFKPSGVKWLHFKVFRAILV